MCLSLMRTGAGVMKYAVFNVLNRFQTYSNSIDCTITTKYWYVLQFFVSRCCVCKFFFYALLGLCIFFLQILPLPSPPLPPLRDQLVLPQWIFKNANWILKIDSVTFYGFVVVEKTDFVKSNSLYRKCCEVTGMQQGKVSYLAYMGRQASSR